ncbi:hypothetical protein Tco_0417968 [Tanacetum coccineum]
MQGDSMVVVSFEGFLAAVDLGSGKGVDEGEGLVWVGSSGGGGTRLQAPFLKEKKGVCFSALYLQKKRNLLVFDHSHQQFSYFPMLVPLSSGSTKSDLSTTLRTSIRTEVPSAINEYLGSSLGDAL